MCIRDSIYRVFRLLNPNKPRTSPYFNAFGFIQLTTCRNLKGADMKKVMTSQLICPFGVLVILDLIARKNAPGGWCAFRIFFGGIWTSICHDIINNKNVRVCENVNHQKSLKTLRKNNKIRKTNTRPIEYTPPKKRSYSIERFSIE